MHILLNGSGSYGLMTRSFSLAVVVLLGQ
uniref:Uncharacterized protein n=1 Tax=Anguilla anguilla TaxID=7936 RepID=A0A0E9P5E9_ANGAN